ncbi:MAG: DUF885 domain-containing protein [Burkholderiaceae bacterium]|nr:DUF885 domain-containing protein [Microbacteriaceae bacterium]
MIPDVVTPNVHAAKAALAALGERYFETQHTYDPYNATMLGITDFDHLPGDPSRAASDRAARDLAAIGSDAAAIDTGSLAAEDLVDHAVLTALVEGARQDAEHSLWAGNASAKGYVSRQGLIFQAVPAMTVTNREGEERYLERLSGLAGTLGALADRYVQEAARRRVPTQVGVHHSIEQLEEHLTGPISEDPLLRPIARSAGSPAHERAMTILETTVRPAMGELARRLREELAPIARPDDRVGIREIPGGEAGYLASVRRHTTTLMAPEEIHRLGLDVIQEMMPLWSEIGGAALGVTDFAGIAKRMRADPALRFETSQQIVDVAQAALNRANDARSHWFPPYEITDCVIEQISPADAQHSALAYYRPPSVDGTRPGAHCLLATDPTSRYRFEYEALAFHESVPGHHLQLASAQTLDIPRYRRYLDVEACSFNEGWGLYSEQFADEIGLYSDGIARLGMLSFRALRASRLVIDTGIHHYGWSREKAVSFMLDNTVTSEAHARSEIDRYIAWPGQALAYMTGCREILRLRAQAEAALGDRFSVADFHGVVLGSGAVPLTVLADSVTRWQNATLTTDS